MGARKRSIDPGIWGDEGFLELSDGARLFFLGLISTADDEGRGAAATKSLKARIFPADEKTAKDIDGYKAEVMRHTHAVFYEVGGIAYYALLKWADYQKVDHPSPSTIPTPPPEAISASFTGPTAETFPDHSANDPGTFGEQSSKPARPLAPINELINKSIKGLASDPRTPPREGGAGVPPLGGAPPGRKMRPETRAAVLPLVTGMLAAAGERQSNGTRPREERP